MFDKESPTFDVTDDVHSFAHNLYWMCSQKVWQKQPQLAVLLGDRQTKCQVSKILH